MCHNNVLFKIIVKKHRESYYKIMNALNHEIENGDNEAQLAVAEVEYLGVFEHF